MEFQIVYDKPGRIRFRCGAYAFDKELETAVQKQMLEHPAVRKAEAHAENGGILVYYEEGARNKVIRAVSALDTRMLIPLGPEESSERIDSDFKTDLACPHCQCGYSLEGTALCVACRQDTAEWTAECGCAGRCICQRLPAAAELQDCRNHHVHAVDLFAVGGLHQSKDKGSVNG